MEVPPMSTADLFNWFAHETLQAAKQTKEPREHMILLKLALHWAAAAQRSRDEAASETIDDALPRKKTAGCVANPPRLEGGYLSRSAHGDVRPGGNDVKDHKRREP
jgi:hypothetical protein